MPTPSTQLALPQIAGSDSPDVPRDINAVITALEANAKYFSTRDIMVPGMVGQTFAGRNFLPADFTNIGLTIPAGIYNCSGDALDSSGNALNLTNKGSVPFTTGILGAASESALFVGTSTQAFYRNDSGGSDPFRFRTATIGCWYRQGKRGYTSYIISKVNNGLTDRGFALAVDSTNTLTFLIAIVGTATAWQSSPFSITDCADDRWHFLVGTFDGQRIRVYVDGVQEGALAIAGAMNGSAGPLNVGGGGAADASVVGAVPPIGRIQAAFLTPDVLNEDQIRYLYASKLAHSMTRTPRRAGIAIRRRRRGGLLVPGDFPATPNRVYNLDDLLDDSGNAVTLTANPGTGSLTSIAGPDGSRSTGRQYAGAHTGDSASDTGLPSGTTARSIGAWIRSSQSSVGAYALSYGTVATVFGLGQVSSGALVTTDGVTNITGPFIADGEWHFVALVADNSALDGVKEKLYLDGRCVGGLTSFAATTLGGAGFMRVGALPNGTSPWIGAIARAFVSPSVLTAEQNMALFLKVSTFDLGVSPKAPGPHIERLDSTNVYFVGEGVEWQDRVDLELSA